MSYLRSLFQQQSGEMAEDYTTVLHQLAGNCDGDIKDKMIHDQLVVGICNES